MLIPLVLILGVKVEGILRQAADVDDVERRIREYEQGIWAWEALAIVPLVIL